MLFFKKKHFSSDYFIEFLLFFISLISIAVIFAIIVFLVMEALPILKVFSLKKLLFSDRWQPVSERPGFGLLSLVLGTVWVMVGALLIAVPLGVGCSIYLAEVASLKIKMCLKPAIELLAGIPSVVYGFFGLVILVPFVEKVFHLPVGQSALVGSLMLSVMALPTIISISEDALYSVPKSYREASLALGTTQWHTIRHVIVPSAFSGISTAIILGMGRVVGETMTVLMVTGNAAVIPKTFLAPVRTLTATIAAEMGETAQGGLHYSVLFLIGVLLFMMTFILNMIADFLSHRFKEVE